MLIHFTDFNNATNVINSSHQQSWNELEQTLLNMPLFLKSSAQTGKQGQAIFDPIANNNFLLNALSQKSWQAAYPMPAQFVFFGDNIDYAKNGTLVEVQFSNYPFLINNVTRADILYKTHTAMHNNQAVELLVIITRFNCLPASNSTLYYEQAINQLTSMVAQGMISIPIRLVGIYETTTQTQAYWTHYTGGVSSRTISNQGMQNVQITQKPSGKLHIM